MKNTLLFALLLGAVAGLTPLASVPAYAQAGAYGVVEIPLVIIRFNQRKINYERALYNAVNSAVKTKPTVMFDVVSFIPPSCSPGQAESNIQQVVYSMRKMGIPADRVNVRKEPSTQVRSNEVHIFVR